MISFFVPGKPQAQGSKVKTTWGMREMNKELGPWRERVALVAHEAKSQDQLFIEGEVAVELQFVLYRPTHAPKTKLLPGTKKPDLDKLIRGVLDALTQVLWSDDAQVTKVIATKRVADHGETPGVHVQVRWALDEVNTS